MSKNKIKIIKGKGIYDDTIFLNGKKMEDIVSYSYNYDINEIPTITIEMVADICIEVKTDDNKDDNKFSRFDIMDID